MDGRMYRLFGEHDWCKLTDAKNAAGTAVDATDPTACSFCLMGALKRCYPEPEEQTKAMAKLSHIIREKHWLPHIALYNDLLAKDKEEILAIVKEAGI